MAALAQRNTKHVPFRNSKLTQLLQDSLCGQAKAMMFIHIAPEVPACPFSSASSCAKQTYQPDSDAHLCVQAWDCKK